MRRIRFAYVVLFFCQWAAAIVLRVTYLTLLGPQAPVRYSIRHIIFGLIITVLASASLVGPDFVEFRRRRTTPGKSMQIDKLYLTLVTSRAFLILSCLCIFAVIELLRKDAPKSSRSFAWAALAACLLVALRTFILRFRVLSKQFGDTSHETRQLLEFVSRLFESTDVKPPAPLSPPNPGKTIEASLPGNARVAH